MCVIGVKQLHQHIDKGKERERGGREGGEGRERVISLMSGCL